MKLMEAKVSVFAENEDEIKELEQVANSTIDDLYRRGYVVSSDVFIRLIHKVSTNPLLLKLL